MLRSGFTKTLHDQRRALVGWALGVAWVTVLYSSLYPAIHGSLASATKGYPEALQQAFSLQDVATPAGYLSSTVFALLGPLLVIVYAVSAGTRAVAGDEESGVLDLLLAHPLSRP